MQSVPERGRLLRWLSDPAFQRWAARFPLTRRAVRREGEALMGLVSGFVQSQALLALIELDILPKLQARPCRPADLSAGAGVTEPRMSALLQAGAALRLLRRRRDGRFALAPRGAALLGVPGLAAMIRHHRLLYRDLEDPVALLRDSRPTELAAFWPYVFGGDVPPAEAARYSQLMADSQTLVAEETLAVASFRGRNCLMDLGGGSGAFLAAALAATPGLRGMLFDLPAVVPAAEERFAAAGLASRARLCPGDFRRDPLPAGADAISLVRVLYDHEDASVAALLARAHAALPPGGLLLISEPMSGGARPDPATDVYFAFYCMAMRSGRVRSAAEIVALCQAAGFEKPRPLPVRRAFLTSVLAATRP